VSRAALSRLRPAGTKRRLRWAREPPSRTGTRRIALRAEPVHGPPVIRRPAPMPAPAPVPEGEPHRRL